MNKQQAKGMLKDAAGKAQAGLGQATGDREQEARGQARQAEGKVQKKAGDIKEGVRTMTRKP